jgi:hypothetical protein
LQDYFELGVVLTRKKLYTQATKNLEKAKKLWDGEESELAQVGTSGAAYLHSSTGGCLDVTPHRGCNSTPAMLAGLQVHNALGFCYNQMDRVRARTANGAFALLWVKDPLSERMNTLMLLRRLTLLSLSTRGRWSCSLAM